jgi:outer membrane protein assembly factor BamA
MVCLLIAPHVAFADTQTTYQLHAITIEGLKRTKATVIQSAIPFEIGDTISLQDCDVIAEQLERTNLFSQVTVSLHPLPTGTEAELSLYLEEKWTLIPVPYFASDGSKIRGGLFLIESNLLGYQKFLLTALYGGSDGLRGLLVFSDPASLNQPWSYTITGGFGRARYITQTDPTHTIRSYTADYRNIGLGVGYSWGNVTSETTLRFRTWQFEPASPASLPAQSNYLEPEWTISYENTSLYDVLPVGIEAQATARTLIMEMGWEVSGSFSWSTLLAHQIRFRLLTSLGFGDMPAFAETAIDAQDGFRTLPFKAATADHWISAAASFDISTLKLRGQ